MTTPTQNESNVAGLAKASVVLAIVSLCLNLLPLVSAWFLMLGWVSWICTVLAIIFGIIGVVKGSMKISIIGLAIALIAILFPIVLSNLYIESAVESTANTLETIDRAMEMLESIDTLDIE